MSFELLSEPIRRYIRDKRWEQLRPIQIAAIERILTSTNNYILASKTASGKTEAAFLPVLSKVDFNEAGVQVLYISPLIALINDQFHRVEELCKYLDVSVTKWHGEANRTLKNKLLKEPNGIVLITPESLEAMFVNHPYNVKHLFADLKYVVIDEIHAFIGTDRGLQLKSLLSRLQKLNNRKFTLLGLSATIGDYSEAKEFTGDAYNTKVLLDKSSKEIHAEFRYFNNETEDLPQELLFNLYDEIKENKVLIFPNSRGRTEEIAVKLRKIASKQKGHLNYFSHHSSVDKDVREFVEQFAKHSVRENFCIVCTSTLELGIDIGSVDEVVQIDATNSISSLIQRVGRSGRRNAEKSSLLLYATNSWSLLQSLACWELFKEGFIEPPSSCKNPFDILLHQILSLVKSRSGIIMADLLNEVTGNFAFNQIDELKVVAIIEYMVKADLLEKLDKELIIGIEGEKIVNNREFYSVFRTEENYKVVNAGNTIGEIPISPQIMEDENILLAARIWKIVCVDEKAKRIEVISAKDGKTPKFFGSGTEVHKKVREKMLELIFSSSKFQELDIQSSDKIEEIRSDFGIFKVSNLQTCRLMWVNEKDLDLYTFSSTRINRALHFLLTQAGIKATLIDSCSVLNLEISKAEALSKWPAIGTYIPKVKDYIKENLQSNPGLINFSKWGAYLPLQFQVDLILEKYYDFQGATEFIGNVVWVTNND